MRAPDSLRPAPASPGAGPPSADAAVLGDSEGDRALRALGVARLAIPVPFVEAGGPVNAYLIDNPDGSLTLFDAGLGTEEAQGALLRGFAQAGRRLEEVRQILVSHGHIDHFGAARFVAERSGAKVRIHPRDEAKVLPRSRHEEFLRRYRLYLERLGVPEQRIREMAGTYRHNERFARPLDAVEPLEEGERLRFRHFEATVLHMPGHTPGLVCLHAEVPRILFSDDHLLARVSPNPLLELGERGEEDKFRALEAYLRSARRLRDLDLDWILPGHGAPFRGHRERVDSLLAFYEKRQGKLLGFLEARPKTAYELVGDLFGEADSVQLFLMLSEVVGNLEVLESAGRARRVPGATPYRWEPAGTPG